MSSTSLRSSLWHEVIGQPDAVVALQAASDSPVHAYLLVGPRGSGKGAAARAFCAELLLKDGAAAEPDHVDRLVREGRHPSVSWVQRAGPSITADQARDVVRRSALSSSYGDRQVFVLDEFHLASDAAPMLLKAVEEPPPSTMFVVLAEEIPEELVTIASRCVNVVFSPISQAVITEQLLADGATVEMAAVAAASAGGDLSRARLLISDPDLVRRREVWRSVPDRLDGTGATACRLGDELIACIDEVATPLGELHEAELVQFEEMNEQLGSPRPAERKRIESRQKREAKRVRDDELRGGLATVMSRYRDEMLSGVGADGDSDPGRAIRAFEAAAALVQDMAESMRFNPNDALALRALLVRLPQL